MSGVITLKLTSLLIRTISKPVANAIKFQSRQSPFLKTNFVRFGQFINKIDMKLRNNSNVKVRPLNDNKAIELGSNFLSELFVFSIAAGLIIYESVKPKKSVSQPVEIPPKAEGATGSINKSTSKADPKPQEPQKSKVKDTKVDDETNSKWIGKVEELQTTVSTLAQEVSQLKSQNSTILEELKQLKPVNSTISHVNKQ
ncbi:hypothetical protein PSN45_000675 [Yamadazyma tenuis]|uniref:OPA3-domain-containing protein n=1 Tax=Candida tenuis (strain ATCC 10573 / BCRC 21748 / CBS 615 / JCM 9827 / NBRC 10315 / NRRL Y-1498 / VKM Y-70) TaxID=590646 RepID=G3B9T6_CANTC|nr:uncharacterized protein CANTEDRAFT_115420 [Yamadazyma tenuis ATCC 10573]XP_006688895.1 uncharacterized protein CANTEDRAFT_115420 [Yamadazyma tenuis ATCC 10573]EGV62724.1 hypothetical protein CANTEDRAFT_115420 [Yamadazyma tenuis ATCC 10573]EGV62725.1 hypothetical protein CANTEDRAFT_115420 [Yamadazyma tenuis ATCC 10573]WEJ93214.1 hypothetical protein PSN45_000675 [Yamadazyma tenuis]